MTRRNHLHGTPFLAGLMIVAGFTSMVSAEPGVVPLGQFPLCEASAAALLTCPDRAGTCLVVGDNENDDRLFYFPLQDDRVLADAQAELKFADRKREKVDDIEALAPLDDRRLLLWGSHSRNTRCEEKPKRRRFGVLDIGDAPSLQQQRSDPIACAGLLGSLPAGDKLRDAVCAAIDTAEAAAAQIEARADNDRAAAVDECNQAKPFNAEGAIAVTGKNGTEVWIGLRAPLLAKHPEQGARDDLAILLRLNALDQGLAVSAVALLDLGGRGVRDLTLIDDQVWVIAGPAEDRAVQFQLRSFPFAALGAGATVDTELVATLPPSSEGLAILGDRAYVVIDGDKGKDKSASACPQSAGILTLLLR